MKTLSCRGQPGDDRERRVFEADDQRRIGGVARRWVVARAVDRRVRPSIYAAKRGGCNRVMTRAELAGGGKQRTVTARAGSRGLILRLARNRKES